ncbi:hypothetical protein HDV01_005200 [Terramyces sp. JEL0728]|nr:hypothetical protein HDV01_005200 [Terramyces sp. JEL0728]
MTSDLNSPIKRHWNIQLPIPPIFTRNVFNGLDIDTVEKPCTAGDYPPIDYKFLKAKRFEIDKLTTLVGEHITHKDIQSNYSKPRTINSRKEQRMPRKTNLRNCNNNSIKNTSRAPTFGKENSHSNSVVSVLSGDIIYLPEGAQKRGNTKQSDIPKTTIKQTKVNIYSSVNTSENKVFYEEYNNSESTMDNSKENSSSQTNTLKSNLLGAYTPLLEKKISKLKVIEKNSEADAVLLNYKVINKHKPNSEMLERMDDPKDLQDQNRLNKLTYKPITYKNDIQLQDHEVFSKSGIEKRNTETSKQLFMVHPSLKKYELQKENSKLNDFCKYDISSSNMSTNHKSDEANIGASLNINSNNGNTNAFQLKSNLCSVDEESNIPTDSLEIDAPIPLENIVAVPLSNTLPPIVEQQYGFYQQESRHFDTGNPSISEKRLPVRKVGPRHKTKLTSLERQVKIKNNIVGYLYYTPKRFESGATKQKQVNGFFISKEGMKKLEDELHDTVENIYQPPPRKGFVRGANYVHEKKAIDGNNIHRMDNNYEIFAYNRTTGVEFQKAASSFPITKIAVKSNSSLLPIDPESHIPADSSIDCEYQSGESSNESFSPNAPQRTKKTKKKRKSALLQPIENSKRNTVLEKEQYHYIKKKMEMFNESDEKLFSTLQALYLKGEINEQMISALKSLLGDDVNFEDIMLIAPEMRRAVNYNVADAYLASSIFAYSSPAPTVEQVFLPESYQRLVSKSLKIPHKVFVPVVVEEIEEEMTETQNNPFFKDFETLLERQMNLEAETLSRLGNFDHDTVTRDIARYPWEDLLQLIWNLYNQMKSIFDEIVPEFLVNDLYSQMHDLQITDEEHITLIRKKIQLLENRPFIYMKAFTGHMQRIIGVCSESIGGPMKLCRGLARLFGNLLFKTPMPVTNDPYIAPKLEIRQILLWEEEEEDEELKKIAEGKKKEEERRMEKLKAEVQFKEQQERLDRLFAAKQEQERLNKAVKLDEINNDVEINSKEELLSCKETSLEEAATEQSAEEINGSNSTKTAFTVQNADQNTIKSDENEMCSVAKNDGEILEKQVDKSDNSQLPGTTLPNLEKRKNSIIAELLPLKVEYSADKKQDLMDKHISLIEIFGWNQVEMDEIKQMILEEDFSLNAYEKILELILRYWDRIFSSLNRQKNEHDNTEQKTGIDPTQNKPNGKVDAAPESKQ